MATSSNGRISELAFKVTVSVFFGIAMLAAAGRILIRLWLRMRLRVDDILLLCSCACLIGATVLLYCDIDLISLAAELTFNPTAVPKAGINPEKVLDQLNISQKTGWAYLSISWVTIFLVKFGFLSLFKQLVDRLPRLIAFWKGVGIFTGVVAPFAICNHFISCQHLALASKQSICSTPKKLETNLAIGVTASVLDMVTDVLILVIPVWVLWRVRIKSTQKLGLAAFLCLSVCMIVMAIIRLSGLHYRGKNDETWIFLWQQIETCVAVTTLSLTAFRTVFIAPKPGSNKARQWVPSTGRLLGRHKKAKSQGQLLNDVSIPPATFTGFSQILEGTKAESSMDESFTSENWRLSGKDQQNPSVRA